MTEICFLKNQILLFCGLFGMIELEECLECTIIATAICVFVKFQVYELVQGCPNVLKSSLVCQIIYAC